MKRKWKGKMGGLLILWLICIFPVLPVTAASGDGTIYGNPYIGFSPDGQAFTTNPGNQDVEWYEKGTTVETGITSSLRSLQTGEHYYIMDYKRTGSVPVGKWTVAYKDHKCIHNNYTPGWHFLDFTMNNGCTARNYSGWVGTCADCGEVFTKGFIYMSQEAAKSLKYIDVSKDYYSICPFDKNLEQGYAFDHKCKGISWNKYVVQYFPNGATGGYMAPTTHMYNNATIYNGNKITPETKLRKNAYSKIGYEFIGWNTLKNGSGEWYDDHQDILNLTSYDINLNKKEATINLYAQWKKTTSTLEIDPAGGSYQYTSGVTSKLQDYGTTYTPDLSRLQAPAGATVSFVDPATGNAVAPSITGTQSFKEWQLNSDFKGKFQDGIYTYQGPQDHVDRLTAVYTRNSITLPSVSKDNASFAGWHYDPDGTQFAGNAGDQITPDQDMTLYPKWVSLLLTATDDYTSNHQKGAVDLVWIQPDMQEKTYIVKQCRQGGSWIKLNSSTDANNELSVDEKFAFSESTKTYQVPYTGLYTLTASGAQGGNFGELKGGLGGRASGKFWLTAGEKLTYNIGGQNGYNGGGAGKDFGSNGGGCTVVTSDLKGDLLIAGGGGGASVKDNGNPGGSIASLVEKGRNGEAGKAGGGGGSQGGKAGEYIVHNHSKDCYQTDDTSYTLFDSTSGNLSQEYKEYMDKWGTVTNGASSFHKGYIAGSSGDHYAGSSDEYGLYAGGHSKGNASAMVFSGLYDYDDRVTPNISYYHYFPTKGNKQVTIKAGASCWDNGGMSVASLMIYNQKEELIYSSSKDTLDKITEWQYYNTDISGCAEYDDHYVHHINVRWNETINLPEDTTGIRIEVYTAIWGGVWYECFLKNVTFSGGVNQYLICDYKDQADGYVVSSGPAYGGSNYINKDQTTSYGDESGKQSGNGAFTIKGESLGYQMASRLDDVSAPDLAAPDAPAIHEKMDPVGSDQVRVSWSKPADHGTLYYHQVTSYLLDGSTLTKNLDSNITENTLTTGVKGYYTYLSDTQGHNPSSGGWSYLDVSTPYATVPVKNIRQYLHVAAVDVAGNISAVSIAEIPPAGEEIPVNWGIATSQIVIPEEENVYRNPATGIYYVRADAKTPFTMSYTGSVQGSASSEYQVDLLQYRISGTGGTEAFEIRIPRFPVMTEESVDYTYNLEKQITEPEYLSDAAYTKVTRKNWLKDALIEQQFTVDESRSGQSLQVIPRASADYKGERTWSEEAQDKQHGLTLIPDGEAPEISGTELLENLKVIDRENGDLILTLQASDRLSGLKSLQVYVRNTDNYCERTFTAGSTGRLDINLTDASDYLFNGDFSLVITAVDRVGNIREVTYGTTEFSLTVSLERILEPHTPVFKCGESGVLSITTTGYADKVEVIFPDELLRLNPDLNKTYVYELPDFIQEEQLEFMVPLYTPDGDYTILVNAYKKGEVLHEQPKMSTAGIEGTVLDEFRTRLR